MQAATVVIIGAGAAGIQAARSLREEGCTKVIILPLVPALEHVYAYTSICIYTKTHTHIRLENS